VAEQDNQQERTEQPTPKRLKDAREKGQVPRSRELTMTLVMLVGSGFLLLYGGWLTERLLAVLQTGFSFDRDALYRDGFLTDYVAGQVAAGLAAITPVLAVLLVAALLAPVALGGWVFSVKALAPKFDRINPGKGLKRVFGPKGLMELAKAMGKFAVVGFAAVVFIRFAADHLLALSTMGIRSAMAASAWLTALALITLSATLIVIAAIDVPFQLHRHHKELRMTRKEVKDEMKETEGNPEMKGKRRSMQQEMSGKRMMEAIPSADVVISNPTHFAVALRYDSEQMNAPVVVAKGVDHLALAIRRVAEDAGVPRIEAPALARALYRHADLGQAIPPALYVAVAEVLSWVYRVRSEGAAAGMPPPDPEVDEDLSE
jgi:flagellar biosynthetic protein FlhB